MVSTDRSLCSLCETPSSVSNNSNLQELLDSPKSLLTFVTEDFVCVCVGGLLRQIQGYLIELFVLQSVKIDIEIMCPYQRRKQTFFNVL